MTTRKEGLVEGARLVPWGQTSMFPSPWDIGVTSFCQDDEIHPESTCQWSLRSMARSRAERGRIGREAWGLKQKEKKGGEMEGRNGGKGEKKEERRE